MYIHTYIHTQCCSPDLSSCARGSSDAVHVLHDVERELGLHHVAHRRDVQAAGRARSGQVRVTAS